MESRPRPRSCAAAPTGWPGCARPAGRVIPTSGSSRSSRSSRSGTTWTRSTTITCATRATSRPTRTASATTAWSRSRSTPATTRTAHPDHPLLAPMDRPHLEAHWERSPKVLPPNWREYTREMKSRLLLEGSFFPGGPPRPGLLLLRVPRPPRRPVHARGVRGSPEGEAEDRVLGRGLQEPRAERALHRPGLEALRALGPVPDADGLPEPLRRRLRDPPRPAGGEHPAAEGVGRGFPPPLDRRRRVPALRRGTGPARPHSPPRARGWVGVGHAGRVRRRSRPGCRRTRPTCTTRSPRTCGRRADAETLAAKLDAFLANMPAGYAPPDRLTKTLDTVRAQGVEGVVIFSAGGLTAGRLWEAVEAFFSR